MALSVRSSQNIRFIFTINSFTGLQIPEVLSDSGKIFVWEVIFTILSLSSMVCGLYFQGIKATTLLEVSNILTSFFLFWVALSKGIYFLNKKRQIVKLMKMMNDILNFPLFFKNQKSILHRCNIITRKTGIIIISTCFFCYTLMVTCYVKLFNDFKLRRKEELKHENVQNVTLKRNGVDDVFQDAENSAVYNVILNINAVVTFLMLIKNGAMDLIMLICHLFVVEELNMLEYAFEQDKNVKRKPLNFMQEKIQHEDRKINMFNKIKGFGKLLDLNQFIKFVIHRFHSESNKIFGTPITLSVGSNFGFLCFVAFSASKVNKKL
jgi:hypothetical protein